MENQQDAPEVLETPETVVETVETPAEETQTDEEKEQLKKKLEEIEKKNKQLYERLKKAEQVPSKVENTDELSSKDLLAIMNASVSEDDLDEVIEFAKYKKISVAEALKNSTLKSILSDKASERKTAAATQTRSARGTSKVSGSDILAKAERTGEVPDDEEGLNALFQARLARKLGKTK